MDKTPILQSGTFCDVGSVPFTDNCTRTAQFLLMVSGELTKLCDYHYHQTIELFGEHGNDTGIFLVRERSRTDWHDSMYNKGVPDAILRQRADGAERYRKVY